MDGPLPLTPFAKSLPVRLLPYVEEDTIYRNFTDSPVQRGDYLIWTYLCPSDPTVLGSDIFIARSAVGAISYAPNAQIFVGTPSLRYSFADGTSQTILFAEHYAYALDQGVYFRWFADLNSRIMGSLIRRAGFADNGPLLFPLYGINPDDDPHDVYPVPRGPASSCGSVPGLTFQVRPTPSRVDPRIPQTPHDSMPVALADGSMRLVAAGISDVTFWSAVTPAGDETLGNDW